MLLPQQRRSSGARVSGLWGCCKSKLKIDRQHEFHIKFLLTQLKNASYWCCRRMLPLFSFLTRSAFISAFCVYALLSVQWKANFLIVLHAPPAKCLRHLNNKRRQHTEQNFQYHSANRRRRRWRWRWAGIKCGFRGHSRLLRSSKWQFLGPQKKKDKSYNTTFRPMVRVGKRNNSSLNTNIAIPSSIHPSLTGSCVIGGSVDGVGQFWNLIDS